MKMRESWRQKWLGFRQQDIINRDNKIEKVLKRMNE